jgi:hypothetical protein
MPAPRMSRGHYQLIADVIAGIGRDGFPVSTIAKRFAADLAKTNPSFNRTRFLEACGVKD